MNGRAEHARFLRKIARPIDVNEKGQRRVARRRPRPAHNELFRVRIKILLTKGRTDPWH